MRSIKVFLLSSLLIFLGGVSLVTADTVTDSVTVDVTAPVTCDNGPSGYTKCSDENQSCSFSNTANVAYGCDSSFYYKDATNNIWCSNSTFGDPAPGVVKACFYKSTFPDLIALAPTPNTATRHTSQAFTSTIENWGNAATSGSFKYFLNLATGSNGTGYQWANSPKTYTGSVATGSGNGGTISDSYTFTSSGTYSVQFCVDKTSKTTTPGDIIESNENNNCSNWTNVTVKEDVLPDLTFGTITNTTPKLGSSTTFTSPMINQGDKSTGVGIYYLIQKSNGPDGTGTISNYSSTTQPLGIGESRNIVKYYTFSSYGAYSVRFCADKNSPSSTGYIKEWDETNNCNSAWQNITISPAMSGNLAASNCTISAGSSSCNSSLSWSTTNPESTSGVTTTPSNTVVGVGNSGSTTYPVSYGTRTFYLYNNGKILDQKTATASCTTGTSWNGSQCVTTAVMSGSLSSTNCTISAGSSSCNSSLSWSTTNPEATSSVTTPTNITIKSSNSGSATYSVHYGARSFYLYNNGKLLSQKTATASCTTGTSWNGSQCKTNVVAQPDLSASTPLQSSATAGSSRTFTSTISNTGTASTGRSFYNLFQFASGSNGSGTISNSSSYTSTLSAGGTRIIGKSHVFSSPGTYSVRVCADKHYQSDTTGLVAESDESNNCSSWRNITVSAAANSAPNAPTISTTSTKFYPNVLATFGFRASDPESDSVKYGVDWNNNGTVDQWLPSSSYVSSNTYRSTTYSWSTTGSKTFRALAQDSNGNNSSWSSYTLNVENQPIAPNLTITASPTSVYTGETSTISWSDSTAGDSCTVSGGGINASGTSGSATTSALTQTTTVTLSCNGAGGSDTKTTTITVKIKPVYNEQ